MPNCVGEPDHQLEISHCQPAEDAAQVRLADSSTARDLALRQPERGEA
jgi:hypothetical protein